MKAVILCVLGLTLAKGQNFDWGQMTSDVLEDLVKWEDHNDDNDDENDDNDENDDDDDNDDGADNECEDEVACGCCHTQQQIDRMKKNFDETIAELNTTLNKVMENLNRFKSARAAFSVGLDSQNSYYGPDRDAIKVIYKHVFLNMDNHYNTSSGIFLVPLSGIYSLSLTAYSDAKGVGNSINACASLRLDGMEVFKVREVYLQDQEDSVTNTILLKLEKGDKVWVTLPIGCMLYDDGSHYNTFSVFLLYPTD